MCSLFSFRVCGVDGCVLTLWGVGCNQHVVNYISLDGVSSPHLAVIFTYVTHFLKDI